MDLGRYGYKLHNKQLFEPVSITENHLLLLVDADAIKKVCPHFRRDNNDPTTAS